MIANVDLSKTENKSVGQGSDNEKDQKQILVLWCQELLLILNRGEAEGINTSLDTVEDEEELPEHYNEKNDNEEM